MRRAGQAGLVALAVLAGAALFAAPAGAAKFPNARQAKALRRAFRRDRRAPKRATILSMKVSTAGHGWGAVTYSRARSKRHQRSALATGSVRSHAAKKNRSTGSLDYRLKGRKAEPTSSPPKPVKKDLKKPFYVDLEIHVTGEEHAIYMTSHADKGDCGVNESRTGEMSQSYTYSDYLRLDLDNPEEIVNTPNGSVASFIYKTKHYKRWSGGGVEDFTLTVESGCGGQDKTTVTCHAAAQTYEADEILEVDGTGIFPVFPSMLDKPVCSDGSSPGGLYKPRYQLGGPGMILPVSLGFGGHLPDVGLTHFSFPRNAYATNPTTVRTDTCGGERGFEKYSCKDTVGLKGTVEISLPGND
jgi:hypothetical protein